MTGWLVLSPERTAAVAAEWRVLAARERPRQPVEDHPPVVVRVSEPVRQDERVEVGS